jgi:hypothetical protein
VKVQFLVAIGSVVSELSLPTLTPMQGLALLHPVLIILFVYPVVGATIRLGILARERRLQINPIPPTVPIEHADHGRWLTGAVVLAVLIAFGHDVASAWAEGMPAAADRAARLAGILLASIGVAAAYGGLLRTGRTGRRLLWAFACWLGLLVLGAQPEVERLADSPLQLAFWQSHYWGGVLLAGMLLLSVALQKEIARRDAMRRLHVVINVLVALLLATQAITGTRDLLLG